MADTKARDRNIDRNNIPRNAAADQLKMRVFEATAAAAAPAPATLAWRTGRRPEAGPGLELVFCPVVDGVADA